MNKAQLKKKASEYINELAYREIDYTEINYEETSYEAGRNHSLLEYGEMIFEAGAEWCINSVWHDVEEKPDFKMLPILLKHKSGVIHFIDEIPANWGYMAKHYVHWAYIDDLLPEKKGGNI